MPWLPFYATEADLNDLNQLLTSENDLALLRQTDEQWHAVHRFNVYDDGRYSLWHVPSGPLPIMPESGTGDAIDQIEDPFQKWTQLRTDQHGQPFFGNATGVFHLNLKVHTTKPDSSFGMSSIEWIGNYFSVLGRVAPEITRKRWDKLRRQFAKLGPRVPRGSLHRDSKAEVFALPGAYARLQSGHAGDLNPI